MVQFHLHTPSQHLRYHPSDDEWKEELHPRGEGEKGGQFVRKGEGRGGGEGSASPERTQQQQAEPASTKGLSLSGTPATDLFRMESDHHATADTVKAKLRPADRIAIDQAEKRLATVVPTDAP
jgi:hypothetical protein